MRFLANENFPSAAVARIAAPGRTRDRWHQPETAGGGTVRGGEGAGLVLEEISGLRPTAEMAGL